MQKRSRILSLVAAVAVILGLSSQVRAADGWDAVKPKVTGAQSYSVKYDYEGEKGSIKFAYAVNGSKIRAEILRGSSRNEGTVIVFDPSFSSSKVRAKIGLGRITRDLTHKDVSAAFHIPIFKVILDELDGYGAPKSSSKDTVRGQACTVYQFMGPSAVDFKVWVNQANEIVKTEKKKAGKLVEMRTFHDLRWNSNPKTDL